MNSSCIFLDVKTYVPTGKKYIKLFSNSFLGVHFCSLNAIVLMMLKKKCTYQVSECVKTILVRYLHEVCEPPIIHRNFKSANVLLDDELAVLVSDCGLAPLILSGAISQVIIILISEAKLFECFGA